MLVRPISPLMSTGLETSFIPTCGAPVHNFKHSALYKLATSKFICSAFGLFSVCATVV